MSLLVTAWCLFFFKQKSAYELRISDWSSDVCSSDLIPYTHSGLLASAVAMDKEMAKRLFAAAGIPCPEGRVMDAAEYNASARRGDQIGRATCRERVCQHV